MTFVIKPSFSGGEISPSLYSRVDIEQYQTGAKTIKNFIVDKHGGVKNRPGTYYIGPVHSSTQQSRLIPFQFSTEQAYVLEFSSYTMRIITDGGIVVDSASSIVEVATPWSSSEIADLDYSQSADVLYIVHPDYFPYKVSRLANDNWTVAAMSFSDGPYASNAQFDFDAQDNIMVPDSYYSSTVTIESDEQIFKATMDEQRIRLGYFDPSDISSISWRTGKIKEVTDSDTIIADFSTYRNPLGHVFNENFKFSNGLAEWEDASSSTSTIEYQPGSYARLEKGTGGDSIMRQRVLVPENVKAVVVFDLYAISAGSVTISAGTTSTGTDILSATNITAAGVTIEEVTIPASTTTGSTDTEVWISVTNTGSSNGDTADIALFALLFKGANTNQWRVPAWTADTGYPAVVVLHEQRLMFGASSEQPNSMWLSKTGDFEDFGFESPIEDDDGFQFSIASGQLNDIKWIVTFTDLLLGTSGAEWAVSNGSESDAITPVSISVRPQSYLGSADLKPIVIGSALLFVQRGANAVHDTEYSLESDSYKTTELSLAASHLFDGKQVVSWAYARNPSSVIWVVLDDGSLIGVTYSREIGTWAWHQHETDGLFESVCSIPENNSDSVYFVVKRTVDGATVRYIEQLMPRITDEDTYDFFFVDSGLTANTSSAITTVYLDHLIGKTVSILANGSVLAQQTVDASGTVTIDVSAKQTGTNIVHAGLPYTSDLQTLDIELSDDLGVSQGRKKIIPRVAVSLYKSRGMSIGPDEDTLDEVKFRTLADLDNPIALYTGDKDVDIPAGYETKGSLFIRNTDPIPLTILAITPEIELSEG